MYLRWDTPGDVTFKYDGDGAKLHLGKWISHRVDFYERQENRVFRFRDHGIPDVLQFVTKGVHHGFTDIPNGY